MTTMLQLKLEQLGKEYLKTKGRYHLQGNPPLNNIIDKFTETASSIGLPLIIINAKQMESIYQHYDLTSKNPSKSALFDFIWDCMDINYQSVLNRTLLEAKIPTKIIQTKLQRRVASYAITKKEFFEWCLHDGF